MGGDTPFGFQTDLAVLGSFFPMRSFIGDCCETAVIEIEFFIFEEYPVLGRLVSTGFLFDNHLKQDIMYRGKDWDIDLEGTPVRAYVVYWNCEHRIIKECVIHAETVWPLTLPEAIAGFRPEFAKGANVNFQFVDGTFSITNIMKF